MSLLLRGAAAGKRLLALERDDPLSYFRFRCDGQRQLAQSVVDGLDAMAHAPNGGGKTLVSAALAVALCQGRRDLDGVKLPGLTGDEPWVHWLIVPTRKQQVQASQKAVRQWLGSQPHEIGYSSRANDYIETVWIRPIHGHSDDRANWSKLIFHCEESAEQSVPGGRVNSANADEYPLERTWSEVRARWIAGRRLLLWIAATPTQRSRYWWAFYEASGWQGMIGGAGRVKGGRTAINWTLESVHGKAWVDRLREQYAGDPIAEARLTGFPVDDENTSPFDGRGLALIRAECLAPNVMRVSLLDEADERDQESLDAAADYDWWCNPHDQGRYALTGDPSKGLEGKRHSPSAWIVGESQDPAVVALHSGRLDAYSFGTLAGKAGLRYRRASALIEAQGGWGMEAIRALKRMNYPNIAREVRLNDPTGKQRHDYGFSTTEASKQAWIGAIQTMLAAKVRGDTTCKIWSTQLVDQLADAVIDKDSRKLVQDAHHKTEFVICLGNWLSHLEPARPLTVRQEKRLDAERSLSEELGRPIRLRRSGGWSGGPHEGFRRPG